MIGTLLAVAVLVPVAGDFFEYATSSGERVTLEIVSVREVADRSLATVREARELPGNPPEVTTFALIRTGSALAVGMPPPADNARLSPLVYFFAGARVRDSWLAQQGVFLDSAGAEVNYTLHARLDAIETVSGPAGKFSGCRRISFSSSLTRGLAPERVTHLTLWLHPDIGIVRSYSVTGDVGRLTDLVQYRKL